MPDEGSLVEKWQTTNFPAQDAHQLAKDVYNNVYAPSIIYREVAAYFEQHPGSEHLTFLCGGQIVPPDKRAFHIALRAIERIAALLNNQNTNLHEDNEHIPIYSIGSDTPVVLRRPLPELAEVRTMPRIASHNRLMRTLYSQHALGIGYIAIKKVPNELITFVGYGNLQTGELAQKTLALSASHKKRQQQGKKVITIPHTIHVEGLGPAL